MQVQAWGCMQIAAVLVGYRKSLVGTGRAISPFVGQTGEIQIKEDIHSL